MKSAGKARNNGLYRHIRTSKEIIRNLLNDLHNYIYSPICTNSRYSIMQIRQKQLILHRREHFFYQII